MSIFHKKTHRYLSFTFDDGFIVGAKKIDNLLSPHKATFYLVTGWIKPNQQEIEDEYNQGINHGSITDWLNLSKKGHEIASHSVSHISANSPQATSVRLAQEYNVSLQFIRQIHDGPYSLAFPYNIPANTDATLSYDSIRLGCLENFYNDLKNINFKRLSSWSPWTKSLPLWRIFWKIARIPSNSWLILNLHSLDGEGWHPWTSDEFRKLLNFVSAQGFQIKTVADMTRLFKVSTQLA